MNYVYTIVFLEKSGKEFAVDPDTYLHYFEQRSNSRVKLELLQKYIFIPIDIYLNKQENKDISSRLNAWLLFLGSDDPEDIIRLIETYPGFRAMYQQIYDICRNTENIMGLFSKELEILDRNTVKYMMDEMQAEIDQKKEILDQQKAEISQQKEEIDQQKEEIHQQKEALVQKDAVLAEMEYKLEQQAAALQEALLLVAQLKEEKASTN